MQVCGFFFLIIHCIYRLLSCMQAVVFSLNLSSPISLRQNDVIFKSELKSFLRVFFFFCFFFHPLIRLLTYALVQISKASIKVRHVRTWEWLHVWIGLFGADTGITLTIQNPMCHKANMHEKTKTDSVWKTFFVGPRRRLKLLQEKRFPHHYHNNETLFGGKKVNCLAWQRYNTWPVIVMQSYFSYIFMIQ